MATTALLGAGAVALATASAMPDMKVTDASSLATMAGNNTSISRLATFDRASRSNERPSTSATAAADIWRLPMTSYSLAAAPFGERAGMLDRGIDMMAPVGTPLYASHDGVVTLARWYGGYGYTVIVDIGNGVQLVYGHASALTVREGQQVEAGQLVALSGNSGYSFAPHVHFEVRVNGTPTDATAYLLDHGVDISKHSDALSN
ncbi:MAG TPA: M23 family metallopeptidase [Micromonosporaceae bacterium]|nr:M23 family metallopeptidase [Micromonosporaceae bacterium]